MLHKITIWWTWDLIKYGSQWSRRSSVNLKEHSKLADFILFMKSLGDPSPCVAPQASQRCILWTKNYTCHKETSYSSTTSQSSTNFSSSNTAPYLSFATCLGSRVAVGERTLSEEMRASNCRCNLYFSIRKFCTFFQWVPGILWLLEHSPQSI